MNTQALLQLICNHPVEVEFEQVMEVIDNDYDYTPTRFYNGIDNDKLVNEAGSNEGSCKIFAFADMNDLNEAQTLACFGKYYRQDVLLNLGGTDHGNIRNFMKYGWSGIHFDQPPLKRKESS